MARTETTPRRKRTNGKKNVHIKKKKTHKRKVSQIRKHNLQSDLKELVKST